MARIQAENPRIVIEIIASNAIADSARREADIAVRHVRPEQPDLIGRHLRTRPRVSTHPATGSPGTGIRVNGRGGEVPVRRCRPRRPIPPYILGLPLGDANFSVLSDNAVVNWQFVQRGLGIGVMVDEVAAATPNVVRVLDEVPSFRFPIWLVTHRELRTARRIRVVFDQLAQTLAGD